MSVCVSETEWVVSGHVCWSWPAASCDVLGLTVVSTHCGVNPLTELLASGSEPRAEAAALCLPLTHCSLSACPGHYHMVWCCTGGNLSAVSTLLSKMSDLFTRNSKVTVSTTLWHLNILSSWSNCMSHTDLLYRNNLNWSDYVQATWTWLSLTSLWTCQMVGCWWGTCVGLLNCRTEDTPPEEVKGDLMYWFEVVEIQASLVCPDKSPWK